jgi:hypothetical protein
MCTVEAESMTKPTWEELKQEALTEALEYYILKLKEDNCNEAAIELFTQVLKEVNPNDD